MSSKLPAAARYLVLIYLEPGQRDALLVRKALLIRIEDVPLGRYFET
jgi:hypothetical protein